MIATIAVTAKTAEKKNFSDRSDHSDHMETIFQRSQRQRSLSLRSLKSSFHMIAAITEFFFLSDLSDHSYRSNHMKARLKVNMGSQIIANVTLHTNGRGFRVACANLQGTPWSFKQERSGITLK